MAIRGDKIVWLRGELRLSQAQLAKEVGVRPATLSAWENDEAEPQGANLVVLCRVLRTTPHQLGEPPGAPHVYQLVTGGSMVAEGRVVDETPAGYRKRRVDEFLDTMKRAGANEPELDMLNSMAGSYLESVLFADGANPRIEAAVDAQLTTYFDILKSVLEGTMAKRGAKFGRLDK